MPLILALGKQRQVDLYEFKARTHRVEFQDSQSYIVSAESYMALGGTK